jgi:hypothetical protein
MIKKKISIGTFLQRRKKTFIIIVKSPKVMGDYIALHGLLPDYELPKKMRGKIPKDQIWMRDDIWHNKSRRKCIEEHEKQELNLMIYHGYTYKEAHKKAQNREKLWWIKDKKAQVEKEIALENILK